MTLRACILHVSGSYSIAPGLGVAWIVQALVGARCPDPGWIDRLGRAGMDSILFYAINFVTRMMNLR